LIEFYGEPNIKAGGGVSNIYVVYERLGIEINFKSINWAYSGIMMDYVVLFRRNPD